MNLYDTDLFGNPATPSFGKMADDFIVPPFSVLNSQQGYWQERKRAWLSLGIRGELGRAGARTFGQDLMREEHIVGFRAIPGGGTAEGYRSGDEAQKEGVGTSIFDPVLCELVYRWFCPTNGQVVDPFAGGSVRGVVAAFLGLRYWGSDLRGEQIEENRLQGAQLCDQPPHWICGDSMETLVGAPEADLVFSCPPYADLEVYSNDQRDLSTMEYHTFLAAYRRIIMRACAKLKKDRFACFVVGDMRDKVGNYRGFVGDTVRAFTEQGLSLYNEAILVTAIGSLPLRVGRQFTSVRKLGKTHQNVLVFVKGDGPKAAKACGPVNEAYNMI